MKSDILAELYAEYHNHALLYVYSLCKSPELAEDIVGTAFFKALSTADNKLSNFKPWLFTVCRNEYYSHFRKHKRHPQTELNEDSAIDREDIPDRIIKNEQYRALYRAISLIPDEQREVIVLFYFSGLSIKEISHSIGKTESNTKVLLHRARKSLKNILEV